MTKATNAQSQNHPNTRRKPQHHIRWSTLDGTLSNEKLRSEIRGRARAQESIGQVGKPRAAPTRTNGQTEGSDAPPVRISTPAPSSSDLASTHIVGDRAALATGQDDLGPVRRSAHTPVDLGHQRAGSDSRRTDALRHASEVIGGVRIREVRSCRYSCKLTGSGSGVDDRRYYSEAEVAVTEVARRSLDKFTYAPVRPTPADEASGSIEMRVRGLDKIAFASALQVRPDEVAAIGSGGDGTGRVGEVLGVISRGHRARRLPRDLAESRRTSRRRPRCRRQRACGVPARAARGTCQARRRAHC